MEALTLATQNYCRGSADGLTNYQKRLTFLKMSVVLKFLGGSVLVLAEHDVDHDVDILDTHGAVAVEVGTGVSALSEHGVDYGVDILDTHRAVAVNIAGHVITFSLLVEIA